MIIIILFHMNRVGAIDSIVDIIGTLLALHHLSVSTVSCSKLPIGEGSVWTDHGQLPVPAFATMRLLIGMKTCPGPGDTSGVVTGELVTPTAAALLRVLTGVADYERYVRISGGDNNINTNDKVVKRRIGRPPSFTPKAVGIGAGTKDFIKHPNVVRLILGDEPIFNDGRAGNVAPGVMIEKEDFVNVVPLQTATNKDEAKEPFQHNSSNIDLENKNEEIEGNVIPKWKIDKLTLLQTNIDDISSEVLSYVMDLLLKNGAIDVWVEPIVMKKGRSAHQLNCLLHSDSDNNDAICDNNNTSTFATLMEIIFRHTTTLGVRIQRDIERAALTRKVIKVRTMYGADFYDANNGQVDVKVGFLNSDVVSIKAEFDHCKIISERTGTPLKFISEHAVEKAKEQLQLLNHDSL